ncbi:hypothetical protein F2Q69_00022326 [Brassica cretica]|uniref:Uncharacterized protein n=1 Tax=Brassica cretica TaxID=69181 RepID=A0A8S9PY79_BRACR|nr:hypothetical protein F2Q69_00022326 [Brassica cretica]
MILYNCDAEALSKSIRQSQSYSSMVKRKCCPELVQVHGFRSVKVRLDIPSGSPKNCPETKGGSIRVQFSLSRPRISVFVDRNFKDANLKVKGVRGQKPKPEEMRDRTGQMNQKSGWRPKKSKDNKKAEPTKKHIIGPKPQDEAIKEVIIITTHQRGECREAEQLCNEEFEDGFY